MKILIVDDHVIVREGLSAVLGSQPDMKVVGEAGSIHDAVPMARQLNPDVILMDYMLPDGTGVDATRAILAENPEARIVFLTVHNDDERLFAALRAGAKGFLLKNLSSSKLITSLWAIEKNEAALSPEMTTRVIKEFAKYDSSQKRDYSRLSILTSRELEILRELAGYFSNAEIAAHLSLSEKTVQNYVHSVLFKLKLKNRREAALFAQEQGLRTEKQPILIMA